MAHGRLDPVTESHCRKLSIFDFAGVTLRLEALYGVVRNMLAQKCMAFHFNYDYDTTYFTSIPHFAIHVQVPNVCYRSYGILLRVSSMTSLPSFYFGKFFCGKVRRYSVVKIFRYEG